MNGGTEAPPALALSQCRFFRLHGLAKLLADDRGNLCSEQFDGLQRVPVRQAAQIDLQQEAIMLEVAVLQHDLVDDFLR